MRCPDECDCYEAIVIRRAAAAERRLAEVEKC
jgi:hypothetical protein